MRADLLVLDMVGTTVRAGAEVPEAFREVLGQEGVDLSPEELGAIRGRSKREAIAHLLQAATELPVAGDRVDAVYGRFQEALREAYRTQAAEVPGAGDALRSLLGTVDVVLTTGLDRGTAAQLVTALGWGELGFAGVITEEDVARGRPAPDIIRAAMDRARIGEPESVVVVGDTVADLQAAANARVGVSIGVLSGAHARPQLAACSPSAILDSVRELPSWLRASGLLS